MGILGLTLILCLLIWQSFGEEVCYGQLGCFSIDPPFNNTGVLPLEPHFINTQFKLFSPNQHTPQEITHDDLGRFDPSLKTKVIIHGFLQDIDIPWMTRAARKLLINEAMNVIIVGWGQGSGFPYTQAASNTRVVAAEVARLINSILSRTPLQVRRIHLIGHSLGAHIAGYAGQLIPGLGRITGLDPAQPNFLHTTTEVHLDRSDAVYVDVIHTDGSTYDTVSGYGMLTPVGHADFYPNGGEHQPGCGGETYMDVMTNALSHGIDSAENSIGCSHDRACDLFVESINGPCHFTSYPCSSQADFDAGLCLSCGNRLCPIMGLESDRYKTRGSYYLQTNNRSPYCGSHYYIELMLTRRSYRESGKIKVYITGSNGGQTQRVSFSSGSVPESGAYKKLYISGRDIGSIDSVTVTFTSNNSYSWFTRRRPITVKRVIAHSLKQDTRMYYCERKTIKSGDSATFHDGTRQPC